MRTELPSLVSDHDFWYKARKRERQRQPDYPEDAKAYSKAGLNSFSLLPK